MNKQLLKSVMIRYGDTGKELSSALGISRNTLSSKMTAYRGADFTQSEIAVIKDRYCLSAEDIDSIFFAL